MNRVLERKATDKQGIESQQSTLTPYHAKYYAHELTKRCAADSMEKLAGTLVDAQVDLNPHQVEAALFAFNSPLSSGAILADEVGLGKTIEAGLVLSQKWATGKRRILLIMPSSLRKQWVQELQEKFFLPSLILEAKSYNAAIKKKKDPFEPKEHILICSYQFAARHAEEIRLSRWDLVVMDEAHRMRNVYKKANKTARTLRSALKDAPKILLTATPLQNSLMELYGLVSFIDEYAFGDEKSFRSQYARLTNDDQFSELKSRIKPLCHRTLRRQVLEYVKYTNRLAITQEFWPTQDEQDLYDKVSDYLQRPQLSALPNAQRKLMTLVMRKLLASSTFAIAGMLDSLINKLQQQLSDDNQRIQHLEDLKEDCEALREYEDELGLEEEQLPFEKHEIEAIQEEISDLKTFYELAVSITKNAKGLALLKGLQTGFKKAAELGAANKVIIFTESRRTQDYLWVLLSENGYGDKLVLFNGTNNDAQSRTIYAEWMKRHRDTDLVTGSRTADMRAALVDYFKESAEIMIATEAAAEGINLQFCSFLVNYDLPWNPQRIEQRIGRCHRYGQQHDVVVINFLNRENAADQRVFELLNEKFSLFSGVFGASDEVLGVIESGLDFEKRIMEIYQTCREPEAINTQFKQLQLDLDEQISAAMKKTREQLLENFDAEVHDKLKVNLQESRAYLDRYSSMLWRLTQFGLNGYAKFHPQHYLFTLNKVLPGAPDIATGKYKLGKNIEADHIYRVGHPLAQYLLSSHATLDLPTQHLQFDYSQHAQTAASLESLIGKQGVLALYKLSIQGVDSEDHLIFVGQDQSDKSLSQEQIQRLFELPAAMENKLKVSEKACLEAYQARKVEVLTTVETRYAEFFQLEMEKLDNWADDKRKGLKSNLKDLDSQLKELKSQIRQASSLPNKLALQRQARKIESKRDEAWREFDQQARGIETQKDQLLDSVEEKLGTEISDELLFIISWSVV